MSLDESIQKIASLWSLIDQYPNTSRPYFDIANILESEAIERKTDFFKLEISTAIGPYSMKMKRKFGKTQIRITNRENQNGLYIEYNRSGDFIAQPYTPQTASY